MTPFQVALFKHFIEGKGMVTIYINLYRRYHLKTNPISVEEFLFKVPETEVCTKAFYWVANMNYGYDYWTQMQLFWMEFLASNENNYTADEWYKLQGMSKILRTNWDAAKHWKQESRLTAAIRLGIDLKLIGTEDKEPTAPPTKLSEEYLRESTKDEILNRDFSAEKEASKQADAPAPADAIPDGGSVLGEFMFVDLTPRRQLKKDEISINRRNKKGSVTFNLPLSKEFRERGGYEYAALMRNKAGDVVLFLNDVNGVPMLDGNSSSGNGNSVINSIELVSRLFVLLNLNTDYHIVNIKEIEKTADHVAYQVYVNNNNNNQN